MQPIKLCKIDKDGDGDWDFITIISHMPSKKVEDLELPGDHYYENQFLCICMDKDRPALLRIIQERVLRNYFDNYEAVDIII